MKPSGGTRRVAWRSARPTADRPGPRDASELRVEPQRGVVCRGPGLHGEHVRRDPCNHGRWIHVDPADPAEHLRQPGLRHRLPDIVRVHGGRVVMSGTTASGNIVGTTDGGTSWSAQTLPNAASAPSEPFRVPRPPTASRAGQRRDGCGRGPTSDGGATWSQQTLPAGLVGFLSISCPSATTCEAVGQDTSNGWMMARTTDGGGSWSLQALPSGDRGRRCRRAPDELGLLRRR